MTAVAFAVGIGVGVVIATTCLVGAAIYDDYKEDQKRLRQIK